MNFAFNGFLHTADLMILRDAEFGEYGGEVDDFQQSIIPSYSCQKLLFSLFEKRAVLPHIGRNHQFQIEARDR